MVGVPQLSGKQKIYTALVVLACEPGRVEARLEAAYRQALASIDAQLELPAQLCAEFIQIQTELEKAFFASSAAKGGTHRRWACDLASRIVAFYDKLARLKSS